MSYKTLLSIMMVILVLNVLVLYWFIFSLQGRVDQIGSRQSVVASDSATLIEEDENGRIIERNVTFVGPTQTCSDCPDRITNLEDEVAELKIALNTVESGGQTGGTSASSDIREIFIPMGSGSTDQHDWTDIPGASTYIDSNNYNGIKTVTFEGSIRVPQGQGRAYIRLYNKTGQHPVWFSEQSTESSTADEFISDPVTLDPGNNLYQVQMKTTISMGVVDRSLIKIILQ